MPVFPTGRSRQFTVAGSLTATSFMQHPQGAPPVTSIEERSYGSAFVSWGGPIPSEAQFASVYVHYTVINQGQPNATHGYLLEYKLGKLTGEAQVDSGMSADGDFTFSVAVDFSITGNLVEMKSVTDTGAYPGGIDDFTTETHLEYFEQFDGDVTLNVSGQAPLVDDMTFPSGHHELHWPGGYGLVLEADDHRRVYEIVEPPQPTSYTTQFNGPSAAASVSFFETLQHTGGERTCVDGYWHATVERDTSVSPVQSRVSADNPQVTISGPDGAAFEVTVTAHLEAYPELDWSVEGHVQQWDAAYAGAVVDDLRNGDTLTADAQGTVGRSYTAQKYTWSIAEDVHAEDLLTGQNADGQDAGPDGYQLNADWIAANGETTDDWRIVLEDDHRFDAFTLSHAAELTLDDFSALDWNVTAGEADLSLDGASGLKAVATADDTTLTKTVDRRLDNYRYLRVRLASDTELTPMRVWMGERYWDVLVEQANTVEEKLLDLCVAHNAQTFDDLAGVGEITSMAFDGLAAGVTYWFSDLTLVRQEGALATVLPCFQDDYRMLTIEVDRKVSAAQPYRQPISSLVAALAPGGDGAGYTVTALPSSDPYYNLDLDCAYLRLDEPFDQDVTAFRTFQALPLYDRIAIYPGVGDPTQPYGSGSFVLRFTKYLHGKVDGLVFIRDLYPTGTLSTTVKFRRDNSDLDTQTTDARRWYRTVHLTGGPASGVAVIATDAGSQYEKPLPGVSAGGGGNGGGGPLGPVGGGGNGGAPPGGGGGGATGITIVNRKVQRLDGRAQVYDRNTLAILVGATVAGYSSDEIKFLAWGASVSSTAGLYGVGGLLTGPAFIYAKPDGYSSRTYDAVSTDAGVIIDVDFRCVPTGSIAGVVLDESGQPVGGAGVWATQNDAFYSGGNNALTQADGSYVVTDLDADANGTPGQAAYELSAFVFGRVAGVVGTISVQSNAQTSTAPITLPLAGSVTGQVTDSGGSAVSGASVGLRQVDGNLSWGDYVTTDAAGNFTVIGVDVYGQFELSVVADGFTLAEELVSLGPGDTVSREITLQVAATIHGTVTNAAGGTPIADADVSALQVGLTEAGFSHAVTDANGAYTLLNLDTSSQGDPTSATYDVMVEATGHISVVQRVTVGAGDNPLLDFAV